MRLYKARLGSVSQPQPLGALKPRLCRNTRAREVLAAIRLFSEGIRNPNLTAGLLRSAPSIPRSFQMYTQRRGCFKGPTCLLGRDSIHPCMRLDVVRPTKVELAELLVVLHDRAVIRVITSGSPSRCTRGRVARAGGQTFLSVRPPEPSSERTDRNVCPPGEKPSLCVIRRKTALDRASPPQRVAPSGRYSDARRWPGPESRPVPPGPGLSRVQRPASSVRSTGSGWSPAR